MFPNSHEVSVFKDFLVAGHPQKEFDSKPILWKMPRLGWIKANIDGASLGSPGLLASGGIFHDSHGVFLGVFALHIGIFVAFRAKILAEINALELAFSHNWHALWLEIDSTLLVDAFKNPSMIPWDLRNKWDNCLLHFNHSTFYVSHIYREGKAMLVLMP